MIETKSVVDNISDTALWVAYFRALETQRPDALFRDPFAERLAGERGFYIANNLIHGNKHEWAWTARTYLFDKLLLREIEAGADVVLNLAAGLDARPYRMSLPSSLRWIEVDLPQTISYKESILANEKPHCRLERFKLDLSHEEQRRQLFREISEGSKKVVVLSEGLLIYLSAVEVGSLATDLANELQFRSWIIDLASPGQLKLMQQTTGKQLGAIGAPFKFGPAEGPNFFNNYGWEEVETHGLLETAAQFNRPPVELLPLLSASNRGMANYPWTGVCLLHKS